MSRNPVLYKSFVIGFVVLFIGVGIQPAIALNESTSISNDEDDCNLCPKVSKSHLLLIESLLNRFERYDTQLSVLSKHYPEFEEKHQELSERITILTEIKEEYLSNFQWDYPVICGILKYCFISTLIGYSFSEEIAYWAMEHNFYYIAGIFNCLYILFLFLFFSTLLLIIMFLCPWFGSNTSMYMLDFIEVPIYI